MIPAQIVGGSRFRLAVLVGLLSTAYVLFVASQQPPGAAPDFYLWWVAARDWRMGLDPYDTIRTAGWQWPLYYPGTTVVLTAPLTWLSPPAAWALFEGLGAGLCCWAITRTHMWRAILFLSGSFLATLYVGQASTLADRCGVDAVAGRDAHLQAYARSGTRTHPSVPQHCAVGRGGARRLTGAIPHVAGPMVDGDRRCARDCSPDLPAGGGASAPGALPLAAPGSEALPGHGVRTAYHPDP